jgi:hypothetical protein
MMGLVWAWILSGDDNSCVDPGLGAYLVDDGCNIRPGLYLVDHGTGMDHGLYLLNDGSSVQGS